MAAGGGDSGAEIALRALRDAMARGSAELSLRDELIRDAGAAALAGALREGACSLQTLDLSVNGIGDAGCAALLEAVQQRPSESISRLRAIEAPGAAQALLQRRRLARARVLWALVYAPRVRAWSKRATERLYHPARLRALGYFDVAHEGVLGGGGE